MANEIGTATTSGRTLYAVVRNSSAQVWSTVTPAFEAYNSAHWTGYALALSEQGASGYYVASFPSGITAPGRYSIEIRVQAGGSPALSDGPLAGGSLVWNGTAEVFVTGDAGGRVTLGTYASGQDPAALVLSVPANKLATNASGQVQHDMTQAVPTSNTAQTVGDALNAARAQGFGKWVLAGATLTLYASDGSTPVHSFTLDSSTNPTTRA